MHPRARSPVARVAETLRELGKLLREGRAIESGVRIKAPALDEYDRILAAKPDSEGLQARLARELQVRRRVHEAIAAAIAAVRARLPLPDGRDGVPLRRFVDELSERSRLLWKGGREGEYYHPFANDAAMYLLDDLAEQPLDADADAGARRRGQKRRKAKREPSVATEARLEARREAIVRVLGMHRRPPGSIADLLRWVQRDATEPTSRRTLKRDLAAMRDAGIPGLPRF